MIWGDIASFDVPGTVPTHCILTSRFKRGQRVGFRMTAIDGGSGETENTAVLVAHLKYAGATIDIPMRWRGQGGFPAAEYPRQPSEMWTGVWVVPADAMPATLSYTVTATDRFGRTATFSPFINLVSQIAIVYRTSPQNAALQWLEPSQTAGGRRPFLYSQGEAIFTRSWIP